jgi:probable HAF family extracellular repeat protein
MLQARARAVALAAAMAASAALATAAQAQAASYRVVDLGTLPGGDISWAAAVNGKLQVAGSSGLSSPGHVATLWQDGTQQSLGQLDNAQTFSDAYAVDSAGEVAGGALVSDASGGTAHSHAFLWRNGRMHDLGLLTGGLTSIAHGLNRYGLVVGEAGSPPLDAPHPVTWRHGVISDLGTFGGLFGAAYGVNSHGTVVGAAALPDGDVHAFRWRHGVMHDLGTLGGANSEADAISPRGRIVGSSQRRNGRVHAFALRFKRMRDLGATASRPNSAAVAVNRDGAAVGSVFRIGAGGDRSNEHAALFQQHQALDLNTLIPTRSGWVLQQATGINGAGDIVGNGTLHGEQHGFLLIPTS